MHELKIASDLSEIVLETARGAGLSKVTRVKIRFGQMIQIVPETFEFAFRETVRGTVAEGAGMEVEIINVKIRCRECGHVVDRKSVV